MGLLDGINQSTYYNSSNSANYGDYQFTSLENIINAFMVAYVGESKLLTKVNRTDVQFHGMRAIQELSYDVLKSIKSQEIEVPVGAIIKEGSSIPALTMILPQDYVNYVKLTRVGSDGIERILYPTSKTSNPFAITQNLPDGSYDFGLEKRTVTITPPVNGGAGIADGDYIVLCFNPFPVANSNTTSSMGTIQKAHFIFDSDSDPLDGAQPGDSFSGIEFYIDYTVSDTALTIGTNLANMINVLGKHTATVDGNGLVTVVYNSPLNSSAAPGEGSYNQNEAASGLGGTSNGDLAFTVTITGTNTGSDLIEQLNSDGIEASDTWTNYQNQTPQNESTYYEQYNDMEISVEGRRYGLDPQHAQNNGSFYIDNLRGVIHFGSDLSGVTVILKYISDGLGTDAEMVVHKFAEEAVYKHIAYGILSTRSNIPPFIVQRFKKEKFAETRKAKIRLSNIKIEEFTQVLKGMGKQIK